jgi:membrane fusion protein (multidrug efflux system)
MDTVIDTLNPPARREQATPEKKIATPEVVATARRKARALVLAGFGTLAVTAAAASAFVHYQGRVSTDDAQVDAHIAPIAPKIAGTIAAILVDDNQPVKAGQVLLRIDPRDYEA